MAPDIKNASAETLELVKEFQSQVIYHEEFDDGTYLNITVGMLWAVGGMAALLALAYALYMLYQQVEPLTEESLGADPLQTASMSPAQMALHYVLNKSGLI